MHADKTQQNKPQPAASKAAQKQDDPQASSEADAQAETTTQMRSLESANNGGQPRQAYQLMANDSPQVKRLTAYQAMANDHNAKTAQLKENKTGLPDSLKSGVEHLSGHSLDDVQVHYNSGKPAELQAHAYAQGTEIHVAPGQERHLPHEAWHVAQQKQGRVQPTRQLKGKVAVNDDAGLEHEADVMGTKAAQLTSMEDGPAAQMKTTYSATQPGPAQLALAGEVEKINESYLDKLKGEFPELGKFKNRKDVLAALQGLEVTLSTEGDIRREIPNVLKALGLTGGAPEVASSVPGPPTPTPPPSTPRPRVPEPVRREPEAPKPVPKPLAPVPEMAPRGPVESAAVQAPREGGAPPVHGPGAHNVVNGVAGDVHALVPKTLEIKNLFRGDSRTRETLSASGFKPGAKPKDYVAKLNTYLQSRSKVEAEADSRTMISREGGQDINIPVPGGKKQPLVDLVHSLTKIEVDGGKKITLLNYVCAGTETGAGATSYLIKVDELFECISASPTVGLYQSASGMQIVAIAQSGSSTSGAVKFTEYDFLTDIPADKIYYASADGGTTQAENGSSWFRITDRAAR